MLDYLLRPFSYLKIDHRVKRHVDWTLPLVFALASTLLVFGAGRLGPIAIFGDSGLVAKVLGFVQNLPGFYIAALAAIATFNKPDIDKHMPEPTPVLDIKIRGKNVAIKLTRRRFLCSMFAFLSAECLLIVIIAIAGLTAAPVLRDCLVASEGWAATYVYAFGRYAYVFVFAVVVWQMLIATFWGLYYLGEKLHQPDAS